MSDKGKMLAIPPCECVENGCKERSEKCMHCPWSRCTWFYAPIKEEKEN